MFVLTRFLKLNFISFKSLPLLLVFIVSPVFCYGANSEKAEAKNFAVVDGITISLNEFRTAYQAGVRKRFYHGKIPEEQLDAFKKEVSQTLIDRVLLVKEAKRLNIKPDDVEVEKQLKNYEKRYENKPFWQQHKAQVLTGLRTALEEENILTNLEAHIKDVPLPTEEETKKFYGENPALFTTPEKMHVFAILLKVAPSSPASVWEAAKEEADTLIKRLNDGADFSEMARIHSGDESAVNGVVKRAGFSP